MKRIAILIIVLVCAGPVAVGRRSAAQGNQSGCDLSALIRRANAMSATGDQDKDLRTLQLFAIAIQEQAAACRNLVFEDTGAKVIGPFEIPKGVYKVSLKSKSYGLEMRLNVIDGQCAKTDGSHYFGVTSDNGIDVETLIVSQGCHVIMEVGLADSSWKISFASVVG